MIEVNEAIIIVDRSGSELAPLTNRRPVCMLPVGNKRLLEITFEELYAAGIRSATVISASHHNLIRETFGNGQRYGMQLRHVFTPQPVDTREAIELANHEQAYPALVVRGDMMRPFGFLDEALNSEVFSRGEQIFSSMGLALPRSSSEAHYSIAWEKVSELCGFPSCALSSIPAYHQANMLALDGEVPGVRPPGRPAQCQLLIGRQSVVRCRNAPERTVAIGANCLVDAETELGDHVAIGNGSIIDVGARLRRSVVLDGSYVGALTDLVDCVVDGDAVLCASTGEMHKFLAERCAAI